ncbi:MAG: HAD family hydrolase [Syntrophomonadaceae bacterium]|jgi:FMN phosphatase YigB (HAD superfamily)
MFKAVLFDLDGTLLNINMDQFLKQYFRKMQEMAVSQGFTGVERLVQQIMLSTDAMIKNLDPGLRNQEVFERDFYQHWHYPHHEFQKFFERFYREGFPQLKQYTRPFTGVPEMLEEVFNKGYKVVIATNAVFPMTALIQRLEWAGLGQFPFDLITSYENMHFCKPQIQYYEEICQIIDTEPDQCLMVGNDVGEDIIASKLGMKTFLVENLLIDRGEGFTPDWRGSLDHLFMFIRELTGVAK